VGVYQFVETWDIEWLIIHLRDASFSRIFLHFVIDAACQSHHSEPMLHFPYQLLVFLNFENRFSELVTIHDGHIYVGNDQGESSSATLLCKRLLVGLNRFSGAGEGFDSDVARLGKAYQGHVVDRLIVKRQETRLALTSVSGRNESAAST